MNIHIVDSVKGGAGKSTFAVKLGCYFALKEKEKDKEKEKEKVKACIIDLDILGTSWEYIFLNFMSHEGCYLNDLIVDYRDFFLKNFFWRYKIQYGNTFLELEVLPCNPSPRAKAMFRTDGQNMPEVSYDFFENEMIRLIDKLEKAGYTDIILDMPPNTEPYSERILESCLQVDKILYKKHKILLYMISSLTPAHIGSTLQWYEDWIETKNTRFVTPDQESIGLFKEDYEHNKDRQEAFLSPENVKKKESASFCFVLNNMHGVTPKNDVTPVSVFLNTLADSNINARNSFENIKERLFFCLLGFDAKLKESLSIFNRLESSPDSFIIQNDIFLFFVYDDNMDLRFP